MHKAQKSLIMICMSIAHTVGDTSQDGFFFLPPGMSGITLLAIVVMSSVQACKACFTLSLT